MQRANSKILALETQTPNRIGSNPGAFRWRSLFIIIAALTVVAAFYFDSFAQQWLTTHRSDSGSRVMQNISRCGDWPAHVALGLLLLGAAWARGSKRWVSIFAAMLVACAIAGLLARVVKVGAGRARPSVQVEARWSGPQLSSKYHAFPSGHTAASAAFFGVLAFVRPRVGTPLLLFPAAIALSRMYVAAHFLSDVVCAFLLGLACAWLLGRWLFRKGLVAQI